MLTIPYKKAMLVYFLPFTLAWSEAVCVSDVFPIVTRNTSISSMVFPIINSCTIANLSALQNVLRRVRMRSSDSWVRGQEACLHAAADNQASDVPGSTTAPFGLDSKQGFLVQGQKSTILWAACPFATHSDWWSCIFMLIAVYFRVNSRAGAAH